MKSFTFVVCSAFVVVGLLVAGPARLAGQGTDVRVGTWKLNLAKSKYPTGTVAPQSITRKYEAFEGDGVKYTADTVAADGKRMTEIYSGHLDGKDYAWTGNPARDAISLKRIDANTFDFTLKKAGKTVGSGRNAVSKDGKTMTVTNAGANGPGSVTVYDKQ